MVLVGLVLAIQGSVVSDGRLAKPTDFDVSLRQITDFCADVSTSSGVQFSVAKNIQDMKVDVFVDKRPLAETLDKVAKVLNCDWVPIDKGYRLEMDAKNVNRERNFNQAEDEQDRHSIEVKLWACEYLARMTPPRDRITGMSENLLTAAQRQEILAPFRKAYEDAEASKNSVATAEALEKYEAVSDAAGGTEPTGIGRILLQMDKQAKERFWKGEPAMGATIKGNGYKLWPSDMADRVQYSYVDKDGNQKSADKYLFSFLAYNPIEGNLDGAITTYAVTPTEYGGGEGSSRSGGPFSYSTSSNEVSEPLKKLPFYQDLMPWMEWEATAAKFPQAIDLETKEWPSPWFGGRRRLGEHLRWLHLATGIPIVSQADRSCTYNWVKLKRPFKTANEYLKELTSNFETFCMEDKGFLLARNFRFWSHRRHEAPESLWQSLEPKTAKDVVTFNQIMPFALNLREDQLRSRDISYPLCKTDLGKIDGCYDMLRFYAGLSGTQRQTALQENGLGADELSTAQQQNLAFLIKKLVFKSGNCSFGMAKYLFTVGYQTDVARQMRLHLKEEAYKDFGEGTSEIKDGDEVIEKSTVVRGDATNFSLYFGIGKDQTIGQSITLRN